MKTTLLLCLLTLSLVVQGQWKSTKGPYGGSIHEYKNEGTSTYVSANGLYRSDDKGKSWIRLDNGLPEFHSAAGFCVDKDEVFFRYYDSNKKEYGFVYSSDRGDHWIKRTLPAQPFWNDSELAYSGGILMASSNQGLLESYDKGITWSSSNLGTRINGSVNIHGNHSYFFAAEHEGRIYRRTIQDTAWKFLFRDKAYYDYYLSDSILLIIRDTKLSSSSRSIDNGLTWQPIDLYGNAARVADFGDSIYYTNYQSINKSLDKGLNWFKLNTKLSGDLNYPGVLRAGNKLLGSCAFGLIRTEDEFNTYEPSSTGIYSSSPQRLIATDSFLFALGYMSIDRFNFNSKKWDDKPLLYGEYLQDLYYFNSRLFAISTYHNHLFVSKDQGQTFSQIEIPFVNDPWYKPRNKIIEFQNKLIFTAYKGFLISNDYGDSWDEIVFKDPSGQPFKITDFELFNQQLILASLDSSSGKTLYYTSTDITNWTPLIVSYPANFNDIVFYEFNTVQDKLFFTAHTDFNCSTFIYEPVTNELIESKGFPFYICSQTLPPFDFRNRMIKHNNELILCSPYGLYTSQDEGLSWSRLINELNIKAVPSPITDILFKDQTTYITYRGEGVLEANWDLVASKNLTSVIDDELIAIPNPSSGIFELKGKYLEQRKKDIIRIYNLQGQCVYQLNDQIYPGYKLNLEDLNPGLYFLKLGYSDRMLCKVLIQK